MQQCKGFKGEAMIKVLDTMCNRKETSSVREREEEETNVENNKRFKFCYTLLKILKNNCRILFV